MTEWPLSNGNLVARVGVAHQRVTTLDRLMLLLPLLMWIAAAIITWLMVSRLVIRPLRRLEHGVSAYRPGEGNLDLPESSARAKKFVSYATRSPEPSPKSRSRSARQRPPWRASAGWCARSITA